MVDVLSLDYLMLKVKVKGEKEGKYSLQGVTLYFGATEPSANSPAGRQRRVMWVLQSVLDVN